MEGLANLAFFPARSESRTPRALEHASQTWIVIPSEVVTIALPGLVLKSIRTGKTSG